MTTTTVARGPRSGDGAAGDGGDGGDGVTLAGYRTVIMVCVNAATAEYTYIYNPTPTHVHGAECICTGIVYR